MHRGTLTSSSNSGDNLTVYAQPKFLSIHHNNKMAPPGHHFWYHHHQPPPGRLHSASRLVILLLNPQVRGNSWGPDSFLFHPGNHRQRRRKHLLRLMDSHPMDAHPCEARRRSGNALRRASNLKLRTAGTEIIYIYVHTLAPTR